MSAYHILLAATLAALLIVTAAICRAMVVTGTPPRRDAG
jgi:hypothetical protein